MGRGLLATVVACIALGAAVVSASEASGRDRKVITLPGSPLTAQLHVRGSDGYVIGVYTERNRVTMSATRGHTTAQYQVSGVVTKDRIDARFGRFGRISVAFRERKVERFRSSLLGCRGDPEVTRGGIFIGTIRFRGEGGYTEADARSARGSTAVRPRWRCPSAGGNVVSALDIPDQVDLGAFCGRGGFVAIGHRSLEDGPPVFPDDPSKTTFLATSFEARGRMKVARLALAFGRRSDFLFDNALTFATVTPPPPFHGSATLTRDPSGGGSWEGSLSVSLPGLELDLVDPTFTILLKRYRQERVERGYRIPPRTPCRAGDGSASTSPQRLLSRLVDSVDS